MNFINKKTNILFLPAWYPNKKDVQLGIFIKKHAYSLSNFNNVFIFYLCSDYNLKKLYKIDSTEKDNFNEYIIYFFAFKNRFLRFINFLLYAIVFIITIRKLILKKNRPNVIISYIMGRTSFIAWFFKIFYSIPFFIFEQSSSFLNNRFNKKGILYKKLIKICSSNAQCIISVSEILRNKLEFHGFKNKILVLPNIIEKIEIPLDETINDKINKIKILSVADLNDEIKNISNIILAVSNILKSGYDFEYHIIGGGKDFDYLKSIANEHFLLEKNIFFHGRQDNEYVLKFMNKIDFLITNSNYETFSVVTAEALACGKPVISTRCGGPESFVNSKNGILININSFEDLKDAIVKMLNSFQNYNSDEIKSQICNNYSYEKIGLEFNKIIENEIK